MKGTAGTMWPSQRFYVIQLIKSCRPTRGPRSVAVGPFFTLKKAQKALRSVAKKVMKYPENLRLILRTYKAKIIVKSDQEILIGWEIVQVFSTEFAGITPDSLRRKHG